MFGGFPIPLDYQKKCIIKTQTFTASGTWTKPANFTGNCVFVSGVGGGGAGGGTGSANNNKYCGGGGGSGCWKENAAYDVSAVSTVAVTIGAGGTGADEAAGGDGTASSFGTLSFPAGKGGQQGNSNKNWGQGGPGGQPGNNGLFIAYYSAPTRYAQGGNGGSTPWGVGGLGATTAGNGNAASANTGGGGGGAYGNDSTTRTGGNGGSGIIIVTWQETV